MENSLNDDVRAEEIETVKGYPEPSRLAKAEKFYYDISDIPRMEEKLRGMDFRNKFPHNSAKVQEDIQTLKECVETLKNSEKLKQVIISIFVRNHDLHRCS